ncbi:MAG: TatD family hydrolase [Candidatus Aenigmarchaeota archaeon]|nr:TatD family hydrolase [Candidatus Aenigmarchaeota archaeon]
MIDVHCHLEQKEYEGIRDGIIKKAKEEGVKGIITCCAHPDDFELTIDMVEKYKGYVFATVSLHPEYVKEFDDEKVEEYFDRIRKVKDRIVGIGETGLDYYWIKEPEWREKQKELFIKHIQLAEELKKPVVIHSRDAFDETASILETFNVKRVHWHMFGAHHLWKRVVDNGWYISLNTIVYRSKKHKKVARDVLLERIMLETDAPWLSLEKGKVNDPTSIRLVAQRIAEIKKISFEEVWETCGKNAVKFYGLPIKI